MVRQGEATPYRFKFNPLYLQTLPERINPDSYPLRHSRESGNPVRWVSVISDKLLPRCISRFPLSRE
ncbi:TPA: hypothetical protein ACLAM0_000914 [Neisseria meningitidis]